MKPIFLLSRYHPQALSFPKHQSVGVDRIKKNSAGVVLSTKPRLSPNHLTKI